MNPSPFRAGLHALVIILLALATPARAAEGATGNVTGRVTNPATSGVIERARITVEGTNLETFSDADGYYRLGGVPAGTARMRVTFSGFPAVAAEVAITAGQTATRDFELTPQGRR